MAKTIEKPLEYKYNEYGECEKCSNNNWACIGGHTTKKLVFVSCRICREYDLINEEESKKLNFIPQKHGKSYNI